MTILRYEPWALVSRFHRQLDQALNTEADSTAAAKVSWIPRSEFGQELIVGSVKQRYRLFIHEPSGRPLRLLRAPRPHALDLVQIDLTHMPSQVSNGPVGAGSHARGKMAGHNLPHPPIVRLKTSKKPRVVHNASQPRPDALAQDFERPITSKTQTTAEAAVSGNKKR